MEALGQFAAFLGEALPGPASVTSEQVRAFVTHLLATRSAATVHNRNRALNRFFNWLVEQEYLERSPMARMRPPKLPERLVPVIPATDLTRLLQSLKGHLFENRRDRAIVSILTVTGVRLAELAGLRWRPDDPRENDVDLDRGELRVRGKGNRERLVALGRNAKSDLNQYPLARAGHHHAHLPNLWLARKGVLTAHGLYQAVKDRGAAIGLSIHPHQFPHTFANGWLASGGNEADLMRLTDWRSRTMPSRYGASAGTQRAIAAHRRLSPPRSFVAGRMAMNPADPPELEEGGDSLRDVLVHFARSLLEAGEYQYGNAEQVLFNRQRIQPSVYGSSAYSCVMTNRSSSGWMPNRRPGRSLSA